jgi:hypothetical protein
MSLLRKALYQLPDRAQRVPANQLWNNGDVAFLLVAPDGYNLEVVVASDIDDDGIFHRAERYWLDDEGDDTLRFLQNVFDGRSVYQ